MTVADDSFAGEGCQRQLSPSYYVVILTYIKSSSRMKTEAYSRGG
jgi:hypothetical protein